MRGARGWLAAVDRAPTPASRWPGRGGGCGHHRPRWRVRRSMNRSSNMVAGVQKPPGRPVLRPSFVWSSARLMAAWPSLRDSKVALTVAGLPTCQAVIEQNEQLAGGQDHRGRIRDPHPARLSLRIVVSLDRLLHRQGPYANCQQPTQRHRWSRARAASVRDQGVSLAQARGRIRRSCPASSRRAAGR